MSVFMENGWDRMHTYIYETEMIEYLRPFCILFLHQLAHEFCMEYSGLSRRPHGHCI